MNFCRNLVIISFFFIGFEGSSAPNLPTCTDFQKTKNFARFMDLVWQYQMISQPEWATSVGYPGQNHRWSDKSLAGHKTRNAATACMLKSLNQISKKGLSQKDSLNYDLLRFILQTDIEGHKFPSELLAIDHLRGVHHSIVNTLTEMPTGSRTDYENILARLNKIPDLLSQTTEILRQGSQQKITAAKMFLEKVPGQILKVTPENVENSPLFVSFKQADPYTKAKAKRILSESVYPAFKKLSEFLVNEYIPNANEVMSWSQRPNGKDWYNYLIKYHTTTDLTADQIHQIGLNEVERLKNEMQKIRESLKFQGDTQAFHKFLMTDPQFFYSKNEDLLAGYRDIAKRIDAELPKQFKTLPRLPYGIREIPEFSAASAPAAYYNGGSLESGRAGFFEANTHDLKARPKWGMEALTIHEAVPGHHLQIALAQELAGLPEFRKHIWQTAFVEGWGLYSESLGEDLGFYKDLHSKYGQLTYEIWRAIRLVIDTGIHAKGWTREQAINYFAELTPKARSEIEVEVDRYITWPGQALAYKIGELKFKELKARAKSQLGEKFNVRLFHDHVLGNGSLPLPVLEDQFNLWLAKQKKELNRKS